jgi:arsenite methyltransferase
MAKAVSTSPALDVEAAVRDRYSAGAKAREEALCCPVPYNPTLLEVIPQEVIERDYGCGDPTRHLRAGETVLDLGSGTGKACFMASQVVGTTGRVIGVDVNDEMLEVARRYAPEVARKIGFSNVEFRKGRIQDLRLDLERLDAYLKERPIRAGGDLPRLEAEMARVSAEFPLIPDDSVDVVVSNCVLNLVKPDEKEKLFREIFRVLRKGGRAVISDIVSDEDFPPHLQQDPELWSGCISGALREDRFLRAFEEAGFYGVTLLERTEAPWRTVEGIELRSFTLAAYKGKQGPCLDQKHAVIYRGPFREVVDDDGHRLRRGVRTAVCEKTYRIYSGEPYRSHFELVPPRELIPLEKAPAFPCAPPGGGLGREATAEWLVRSPRETKGADYRKTIDGAANGCSPGGGCC